MVEFLDIGISYRDKVNKKKSDEQAQELMVADSIRRQSGFDILAMTELLTILGQAVGLRRYFSPECFLNPLNLQKVPKLDKL